LHDKADQNFDDIADKFEKNIYGTTKGQLRHELLLHYLKPHLPESNSRILDAGGGTGEFSREMLALGYQVTLNDISEQQLQIAKNKLPAEHLSLHCGELQSLEGQYELVICHAVLEWLKQPFVGIDTLLALVKPGGKLSLSFFNKDAARFGNLLYGNFDFVKADMRHKNRVRLSPNNPITPKQVLDHLQDKPVTVLHQAGIRCIHDYLKDPQRAINDYAGVKEMELAYGRQQPYLWLGKYFHLILQRDE